MARKTDPLLLAPADPAVPVRDPATGDPLPHGGGRVPDTPYWRRRLADGDVRIVPPPSRHRRQTPAADPAPAPAAESDPSPGPGPDPAPPAATRTRRRKD